MINEITTPCYVVDKKELQKNIVALKKALDMYWHNYKIGYSYKTNSIPWILQYMLKADLLAEVVSATEYDLAEKMGYEGNIIYNGPVKSRESFEKALQEASNVINIDSKQELCWLKGIKKEDIKAQIGLRVNFDLAGICPGETVAEKEIRFGFSVENDEFTTAINALEKMGIELSGLHMHVSTKTRSFKIYKTLIIEAAAISKKYHLNIRYLDIGGGFFAGGEKIGEFKNYMRVISDVMKKYFEINEVTLIVEPGAALIASPVVYYTKVIDEKKVGDKHFITVDGSRLHVDPFMKKQHYDTSIYAKSNETERNQIICGCTCMENDRFFCIKNGKRMQAGDLLKFCNVGSYTMCLNSLFIDYFPNVYIKEDDKYELVRRKWGIHEFLQNCKWEY